MRDTDRKRQPSKSWQTKTGIVLFLLCSIGCVQHVALAQKVKALKPLLEVYGNPSLGNGGETLGRYVGSVGDINGDGWPDFAVSAGGTRKLQVYFGGPGILDAVPGLILKGTRKFTTGDFNGDGLLDIASAYRRSMDSIDVAVYFGTAGPGLRIDTSNVVLIPDPGYRPGRGHNFASFLASGDINGDGKDELVIVDDIGQAWIYLGKDPWLPVADYITPERGLNQPNLSNAYIADVDGDGYKDLMFGYDDQHPPVWNEWLNIYKGRSNWSFEILKPDQILLSESDSDSRLFLYFIFSSFVDLRNVHKADASVNRSNVVDSCFLFRATAQLYPLVPDDFRLNPDHQLWTAIGAGVYKIGDINKDGWDDFAWGAGIRTSYSVMIFPGGPNGIASSYPSRRADYLYDDWTFGNPTVGIGDVNGDGVNDILASSWLGSDHFVSGYFAVFSGDSTMIATPVEPAPPRPAVAELNAPYPNPSRDGVVIGYTLPAFQRVRLSILDALGREIRVLENDFQHAGTHNSIWNGSTRQGTRAAPGLYICRLESGGAQSVRRVTLLR
jgi:hypothetical protein